ELQEPLRLNADRFLALKVRWRDLLADSHRRAIIEQAIVSRAADLRIVVKALRDEARDTETEARVQAITGQAARSGRSLTRAETAAIAALRDESRERDEWKRQITSPEIRDRVLQTLGRARVQQSRAELQSGLVKTPQMRAIIAEATPALRRGD